MTEVGLMKPGDRFFASLTEKRRALRSSGIGYDRGDLWEAKRIASEIYMLVHDGKHKTKSVLSHLGILGKLDFLSSIEAHPLRHCILKGDAFPPTPLVSYHCDDTGWQVVPNCHGPFLPKEWNGFLSFRHWWEEPVARNGRGLLSRKNFVFSMRDQDGGAHVDAELKDPLYAAFLNDIDVRTRVDGKPIAGAHLAVMRQIGWEMEETLDAAFGDLGEVR